MRGGQLVVEIESVVGVVSVVRIEGMQNEG
jgi:hypothetical protein